MQIQINHFFFIPQYLVRTFSVLVEKIWLVVQGKGPINDDMKEQRQRLNLEILSKIALKEESVKYKGDIDKTYNLDLCSVLCCRHFLISMPIATAIAVN